MERLVGVHCDDWYRQGWCLDADDDGWFFVVTGGDTWSPWRAAGARRPPFNIDDYADDYPCHLLEVWSEATLQWVSLKQINLVFTIRPGSFILLRSRPSPTDTRSMHRFDSIRHMLRSVNINPETTLLEALPWAESAWWTCTPGELAADDPFKHQPTRPW